MKTTQLSEHFSLDMLARVAQQFAPPREPFRSEQAWENRYTLYCLVHNNRAKPVYGNPAGSLVVRRVRERDRWILKTVYRKVTRSGPAHRIAVETAISGDSLSTPLRWNMTAEFAAPGSASAWLRIEHVMQVKGGKLELSAGGRMRSMPRPPAYTSAWTLLDAVQRLPRRPGNTLRFTFFDRNGVAKPGHILRYRETVQVEFGGVAARLHGFEHLGDGFVPSVYWVDDTGRLVLFHHSLQGYVMQPADREGSDD